MNNKNLSKKEIINMMFISSILIKCGYKMDININYKTIFNNLIMYKHLNTEIDDEIIKYVEKNINFSGKILYLRNKADSECMIYYNHKVCHLVFIGTQIDFNDKMSLCKDIWTDICLGLETIDFLDSQIKIHSKYISNMKCDNLIDDIIKFIKKSNFTQINICGHSMGCGLGLYTTLVLAHKFTNKYFNLITLDSPKIGNDKLNKYVKKIKNLSHFGLINGNDIVPLYPFMYPEYLYIGSNTFITNDNGDFKICKKPNKLNIFTNHSIKDHSTNNIITKLYYCLKN